jgi:hypothetical protein
VLGGGEKQDGNSEHVENIAIACAKVEKVESAPFVGLHDDCRRPTIVIRPV